MQTKLVRGFLIALMAAFLFALGWGFDSSRIARALKVFHYYGVGNTLYPIPGSKVGDRQLISFNGYTSVFLPCSIAKPLEEILQHYRKKMQDQVLLNRNDFPAHFDYFGGMGGDSYVHNGMMEVLTSHYAMWGAVDKRGNHLGVVAFRDPTAAIAHYYLCFTRRGQRQKAGKNILPIPPFSKQIFFVQSLNRPEGFFLYKSKSSLERLCLEYRKRLIRRGWKEKSSFSAGLNQAARGYFLAFRKGDRQALVHFSKFSRQVEITVIIYGGKK